MSRPATAWESASQHALGALLLLVRAVDMALRTLSALLGSTPTACSPHHFAKGQRVLVVGPQRSGLLPVGIAQCGEVVRLRSAAEVHEHACKYDVVCVEGLLSGLPEEQARTLLAHICDLVVEDGRLIVSDLAALPGGYVPLLALLLLQACCAALGLLLGTALPCGPPYDVSAWLPSTMWLLARNPQGPFHEELVVARRPVPPAQAVERLRQLYGSTSMAYCTSSEANRIGTPEAEIRHFLATPAAERPDGANEIGYVAFLEHVVFGARLRLVLMDPVCAEADVEATLESFLADCQAAGSRPVFACVSGGLVEPLRRLGLGVCMLGGEVGIKLAQYKLSKDNRRYLRAAPAKGLECHTECYDFEELEALNATWVASKASGTEVKIWTWPPSMPKPQESDDVKRIFTYQDGRLVGFVCAEPYYHADGSGRVKGYGLNTIRFQPQLSPAWISDYTVATLVQSLQADGQADFLAFGLSPWSEVRRVAGDIAWLRFLFQRIRDTDLEHVYSIRGLAKKKEHHCAGQGVPLDDRFVATPLDHAFADTLRFTYVLLGDCLEKLPSLVLAVASQLVVDVAAVAGRCLRLPRWGALRSNGRASARSGSRCVQSKHFGVRELPLVLSLLQHLAPAF